MKENWLEKLALGRQKLALRGLKLSLAMQICRWKKMLKYK